jgi:hypothetical protein
VSSLLRQPVTLQKATARGTRSRYLLLVIYFSYTSSHLHLCTVAYHSHIEHPTQSHTSTNGSEVLKSQVSALPSTKRPYGASPPLSGSVAHEADACSINGPHRSASEVACTRLASSRSEVANRSSAWLRLAPLVVEAFVPSHLSDERQNDGTPMRGMVREVRLRGDWSSLLLAKLCADRVHRVHRGQRGNARCTPLVWPTPPISRCSSPCATRSRRTARGRPTGRSNERGAFLRRQNARQPSENNLAPRCSGFSSAEVQERLGLAGWLSLLSLTALEIGA